MRITPNPADESITITYDADLGSSRIVIYDLSGKQVITDNSLIHQGFQKSYSISALPAGMYLVRIISGETTLSGSFIKK